MASTFSIYTKDLTDKGEWHLIDERRKADDMRHLADLLLDDWLACDIDLYGIVEFLRFAGSERVWPVKDEDIDDGTDDKLLQAMAAEARVLLDRGEFEVALFFMMLGERLRVEVEDDDSADDVAAMIDAVDSQ